MLTRALPFSLTKGSRLFSTKIVDGVLFNTIAREWRLKWDSANDKKSLADTQKIIDAHLSTIKAIDGVKSVQRIVCGGCLDYKLIVALEQPKFGAWANNKFAPEEAVLAQLKAVSGVSQIETQTYTIEPL